MSQETTATNGTVETPVPAAEAESTPSISEKLRGYVKAADLNHRWEVLRTRSARLGEELKGLLSWRQELTALTTRVEALEQKVERLQGDAAVN